MSNSEHVKIKDPLALVAGSFDDWYCIERAEHDHTGKIVMGQGFVWSGRISDADVEGNAEEMLAIAEAIETRADESFKRCAVDARTEQVKFWSPRNSRRPGIVSRAAADALAKEIREKLGAKVEGTETNKVSCGGAIPKALREKITRAVYSPRGSQEELDALLDLAGEASE